MMPPKISVIIPVYNVERYLDKCVQSVLGQTLADIEIILVDDGSPDRCGEMCDEYARQDSRVRVIHKPNGGLSDARNAGIRIARADYVGFVDSDDYVAPDMYEQLYDATLNGQADVVCGGIINCYNSNQIPAFSYTDECFTMDGIGAIQLVLAGKQMTVSAPNKLYKKSLLYDSMFPKGRLYEDAFFIIPYLLKVKTASFNYKAKYYYVHHSGTITTSSYSKAHFDIIEAWGNNLRLVKAHCPQCSEAAYCRYYWSLFIVFDKMLQAQDVSDMESFLAEKRQVKREIQKNYFPIMGNRYLTTARKIAVTGLMIHEALYKFCLKAYNKKYRQLFE